MLMAKFMFSHGVALPQFAWQVMTSLMSLKTGCAGKRAVR